MPHRPNWRIAVASTQTVSACALAVAGMFAVACSSGSSPSDASTDVPAFSDTATSTDVAATVDASDTIGSDVEDGEPGETSVRGNRYCELLVVTLKGAAVDAQVWGTQGLNACPAEDWASVVPEDIVTEFGATTVKVNGPRYWVLDRVTGEIPDEEPRLFGTLEMRKLATITLAITELSEAPYTERTVNRNSEFEFNAGAEVYELVAEDGAAYVMQSYAQIVDPALTEAALARLAARLTLPDGWTYRSRVLDAPLVISTPGKATVLQDDLQNTYSRVPTRL